MRLRSLIPPLGCGALFLVLILALLLPISAKAGEAERQAALRVALLPTEETQFAQLLERRRKTFITLFVNKNPGKEQAVATLFDTDLSPRIREQWGTWFERYVAFLASRLNDEDVAAYVAFRGTPAGRAYADLNVRDDVQESARKELRGELGLIDALRLKAAVQRFEEVAKEAGMQRPEEN